MISSFSNMHVYCISGTTCAPVNELRVADVCASPGHRARLY
jgi:hypothetical protein